MKKISKLNVEDISKIHGISKKRTAIMIDVYKDYILPPYKNWHKVIKIINIKPNTKIIDLACANGRTAVNLAKKYHTKIIGVDVVPEYLEFAKEYASKERVNKSCRFVRMDARKAVLQFKNFDVVLWLSAPHLWGGADKIIKNLRNCCKYKGHIVIYDAYYLPRSRKRRDTWYSLNETTRKFEKFGDKVIKIFDEKNKSWQQAYNEDRKIHRRYLKKIEDPKVIKIVNQQLKKLDKMEKWERENFGTAFWIIKVNKSKK